MSVLRDQALDLVVKVTNVDPKVFKEFEFRVDDTALSSIHYPLVTVVLYCIGIPLLQNFMKGRKAPPLKWILVIHNLFLSFASAFLAFLMIVHLLSFYQKGYSFIPRIVCGLNHYEQQGLLTLFYYVNYLLKYYELLDTIFLALKHRPIGFLHAYHHPATLVLTWGQLVDSTGVQWIVILLNLFVHTVMYFYYCLTVLKIRVPFKRLVTIMQIVQFVIDLVACYAAFAGHHWFGICFGTSRAGVVGIFILTSYLFLFIDFYFTNYSSSKSKGKKKLDSKKDR